MGEQHFTVLDLLDMDLKEQNSLNLKCIGGRKGLVREINIPDINRPGLALSGFFDSFAYERLQVFGRGEVAYLLKLEENNTIDTIRQMFTFTIPCCVFTHNLIPDKSFIDIAEKAQCPILLTDLPTAEFSTRIMRILSEIFAPRQSIH